MYPCFVPLFCSQYYFGKEKIARSLMLCYLSSLKEDLNIY